MDLFTYGSLMFPAVWERVTGLTRPGIPARLGDYAARRIRDRTYPALVPAQGEITHGVVYQNIPMEVMSRLDAFEGEFYHRVEVALHLSNNTTSPAWVYRASRPAGSDILAEPWNADRFAAEHLHSFLEDDPGFSDALP